MRRWFARAVLVAGCLVTHFLGQGAQLHAQQDGLSEIYGQGVHRYFAGDYSGAELLLNQVQASGSEDPRVHYFLGMCKVARGGGVLAGLVDMALFRLTMRLKHKVVSGGRSESEFWH